MIYFDKWLHFIKQLNPPKGFTPLILLLFTLTTLTAQEPNRPRPTDGMTFIAPPFANNQGSAVLNYPLHLPAGRQGMEPGLSVDYSSDNGNSWLGLGWDLSLPAITIDTRWGVPRYSSTEESESYFYDGQALFPQAHRGAIRERTPEQEFYPRIESAFERIIRHGDNPNNYWWEVTDKDGTRFYYGGHPEEGMLTDATLTTTAGAIVHWALVEVIDVYGNFMRYTYSKVAAAGNNSSQLGEEIYPKDITYTGHGNNEGIFKVRFIRDRDLGEALRVDASIDCRLGFKRVQADLLRRVEVYFQEEIVRAYRLEYTLGAFQKTLLQSIVEEGKDGTDFYQHDFDYYDDVRPNGNYAPYQSAANWTVPDDNILGDILNPISGMNGETSAIGGAKSTNFNVGGAATVGPNDFLLFSKDKTAGGTYAYGNSSDEGLIAMVDINSDGLLDKMYRKNGALHYRPSLAIAGSGETRFGDEHPIHGLTQFSTSTTSSNAFGAEGNPPFAYVGFEYTKSNSTNNTYFSDFNGDGLLDIAQNGTVWFNHLDANGDPTFTTDSGDTPSPISSGAEVDGGLFEIDPEELEEAIDQYPLHDVVRMWQAPFGGIVEVVAPVQLAEPIDPMDQSYDQDDGVRVVIQHNNTELWSASIDADDYNTFTPTGINSVTVNAGDRLYFRVQSVFDGKNDQVNWSPTIDYLSFTDTIALDQQDANGLPLSHYQASEDFILTAKQEVGLPLNGTITINGSLEKAATSDDIIVQIVRWRAGVDTILYTDTLLAAETVLQAIELDLEVQEQDALDFLVFSDTQLDWQTISWMPNVFYTASPDANVYDPGGEPLFSFCPTVGLSMYNHVWRPAVQRQITTSDTLLLKPVLSFTNPAALNNSELTLSVKGEGVQYKTTFPVNDYQNADTLSLVVDAGAEVFIEYHFSDWEMAQLADRVAVGLWTQDTIPDPLMDTITVAYASVIAPESTIFGHLYRGWGQFEYNGNRDRANLPINQAELVLDLPETDPDEEIPEDPEELDGLFDPTTAPFLVMLPDAKTQCYLGYDEYTYLSATVVSSSRLGEDNILPQAPASSSGLGLSAPNRTTVSNEYSVAGGLGFSVITGTASKSWVDTEVTMDVLDFNGDRYPDIISGSSIQYTASRGGYLPGLVPHNIDGHHAAKSEATGFTLGGSFVPSRTSNSGEPKGGSSNKRAAKAKRRSGKLGKNAKNGGNTAGEAVGINGTFSEDGDWAVHSWTDINGDGLIDKVKNDGTVALNYGYSFGAYEPWGFTNFQAGESVDFGGGLGLSLYNGSIAGGISLTRTDNFANQTLEDINGDGFPDIVSVGENETTVQLNTGTGFGAAITWTGMEQVDAGSATGESVNAAFTVCIPIFFVKVCINPSSSVGRGVSKQIQQVDDVDGDGFPDLIRSNNDGELSVQRSSIGRTNLLRTVNRPLGVSFTFDYSPQGTTYDQPYAIWAMTSFEMTDGLAEDGDDRRRSTYSYTDGKHHRDERAFLGFGTIRETRFDTETNAPYSYHTQLFNNDNYYEQGLLEAEYWENAATETVRRLDYIYELREAETSVVLLPVQLNSNGLRVFPALVQQKESWANEGGSIGLSATRTYDYDQYGSLIRMKDMGSGDPRELLDISFSYHYQEQVYAFTTRDSVIIRDANGLVRQRSTALDGNGNVASVQHYIDAANQATFTYQYDEYGNTTLVIQPPNVNGQQFTFSYTYDTLTHTYPITETDVYGQVKERNYDLIYGEELYFKDENGLETTTEIDEYGRVVQRLLAADREVGSDYTFRYYYQSQNNLQRLKTERFDPEHPEAFETYAFEDGLGRILQEQETIEATAEASIAPSLQFRVSGQNERDAFGRTVATYYPRLIPLNNGGNYQSAADPVAPLRFTYDVLDRPLSMTTPAGDNYTLAYDFSTTPSGVSGLQTTITDPLGREIRLLHNVRGQLLAEANTGSNGLIWTEYFYNGVSERTMIVDAAGNETHYSYDGLGRLIQLKHPDGGQYDYTFDAAGNLLSLLSPAIREREVAGAQINYFYDYDRLQRIDYPFNPQNQVRYTWGDTTSSDNRNGRVYLVEDASGAQELWYNSTGDITKVVRTMIVNEIQQPTYVSEYDYDSWGRLKTVYYPDGEIAEYTFNRSGAINSLMGEKEGRLYEYVRDCWYDKFGDRLLINYGNGTQSSYTKAPSSNRFDGFVNKIAGGAIVSNQSYTYDAMGHLLSLTDNNSPDVNGARNQQQTFTYDEAYRLTSAEGSWEGTDKSYSYQMDMEVDGLYNVSEYLLRRITTDTTDRSQAYAYEGEQAHFPTKAGDWDLFPNPNGNQQERSNNESFRLAQYDEEDRLTALSANGYISYYSYDAAGQRAIKSHGPGSGLSLDATPLGGINHGERDYTLYVSPFMEVTSDSFRKHYYLEDIRIASKKGSGFFVSTLLPPGEQITAGNIDLADRIRRLRDLLLNFTEDLGVPPGHPSLPFFYVDGGEEAVVLPQLDNTDPLIVPPPGWPAPAGPPDPAGPPGHPVWYAEPASPASAEAGYGYSNPFQTPEVALYYYHYNPFQDLLQVSGANGSLLEQWAYLPFGEVFVGDELSEPSLYQAYRNYGFDRETGLYFSGSNYYDPQDLLWLALDDKATVNPYRSPYLFGQGQSFPGSDLRAIRTWANDNTNSYFSGAPEIALAFDNEGGSFSDASFTILSGPQAAAVEIAAADGDTKSEPKKNKPQSRQAKKSGGKTGVVGNQGLLALRRQFKPETDPPGKVDDSAPSATQAVDAATKRKHRQFTIRPGDWDGITIPGNRHFQFKPEVEEPVSKKYRRQANPRRVRFRLDRQ